MLEFGTRVLVKTAQQNRECVRTIRRHFTGTSQEGDVRAQG
jgi:hypothetical protein